MYLLNWHLAPCKLASNATNVIKQAKEKVWHVMCDMWNVTCDMWHVACAIHVARPTLVMTLVT